jgi:hypothetical protein
MNSITSHYPLSLALLHPPSLLLFHFSPLAVDGSTVVGISKTTAAMME